MINIKDNGIPIITGILLITTVLFFIVLDMHLFKPTTPRISNNDNNSFKITELRNTIYDAKDFELTLDKKDQTISCHLDKLSDLYLNFKTNNSHLNKAKKFDFINILTSLLVREKYLRSDFKFADFYDNDFFNKVVEEIRNYTEEIRVSFVPSLDDYNNYYGPHLSPSPIDYSNISTEVILSSQDYSKSSSENIISKKFIQLKLPE